MSLLFGLSKQNITPGFPTCLACSQQKDTLYERVHDDIYVRCVVLKNNKRFVLIISYDLLFHSRDLHDFIYNHAKTLCNLKKSDILVNFTHNHNSPSVLGYNDYSSNQDYENLLRLRTAVCLEEAFSNLQPGSMQFGSIEGNWNINRRRNSPEGIKLAPNPAGPVDENLYILKLLSLKNEIKGLLVNYACHPVHYSDTLGLTSEYPGYLCNFLDNQIQGCISVFIQGAGADTRPLSTVEADRFVRRSFEYIEKMAASMGNAIIEKINSSVFYSIEPDFSSVSFSIEVPTENKGLEYFNNCNNNKQLSAHLRRNSKYMLDNFSILEDRFFLECGLIKLGQNFIIAHMGGEPVCEVKFNISDLLSDYKILFAGYTDACAYIVTDKMLDEGGYEVDCFLEYMHKGPIKKGIDNLILTAYKSALPQLS